MAVQSEAEAAQETGAPRRQALLLAMIAVVGKKGYSATSVADVIAESSCSRTTFYKHFDNKLDCFLAAYDLALARVLRAIEAACKGEWPWVSRAQLGLVAAVELLADEPELARTVVVEAAAGGAQTREAQIGAHRRIARSLDRDRDIGRDDLPAETGLMAVSAVNGLLFEEVRCGRAADLPEHLPDLLFALLVPFLGPGETIGHLRRHGLSTDEARSRT